MAAFDLKTLDVEARQLLSQFSSRLIIKRVLLTDGVETYKSMIMTQLSDIVAAYIAEIEIVDRSHPGSRVFPSLRSHHAQVSAFYRDIVSEYAQSLKDDTSGGLRAAKVSGIQPQCPSSCFEPSRPLTMPNTSKQLFWYYDNAADCLLRPQCPPKSQNFVNGL